MVSEKYSEPYDVKAPGTQVPRTGYKIKVGTLTLKKGIHNQQGKPSKGLY